MIFIGYQGIGKSTLAHKNNHYFDFESSWFYHNGKRAEEWYIYYTKIAEKLSEYGLDVFVSSHKEVRDALKNCSEPVCCIVPSFHLREEWCEKLEKRYRASGSDKDYRAWMNAEDRYVENIEEIVKDYYPIVIESIDYNLDELITEYKIDKAIEEIKRKLLLIEQGGKND